MDTTGGPTTSPEPIYHQMVVEADDTTRMALAPAKAPELDAGLSDVDGSG
jgi:hypothetical protein